ncbi:MAG: hypothetical protein R3E96_09640 [Planctomycetota bacterium]
MLVYHRRHQRLVAILTERKQLLPGASIALDQAENLPGLPSDPSDGWPIGAQGSASGSKDGAL